MDAPIVFRISPLSHLAVLTLAVCVTPVALAAPVLLPLYLVPLGISIWIIRFRTTADTEALVARTLRRTRRVAWSDITSLRLRSSRTGSRVSAVLADGSEQPLPAVHVRDLPLLATVSGGRIPDLASPEE